MSRKSNKFVGKWRKTFPGEYWRFWIIPNSTGLHIFFAFAMKLYRHKRMLILNQITVFKKKKTLWISGQVALSLRSKGTLTLLRCLMTSLERSSLRITSSIICRCKKNYKEIIEFYHKINHVRPKWLLLLEIVLNYLYWFRQYCILCLCLEIKLNPK